MSRSMQDVTIPRCVVAVTHLARRGPVIMNYLGGSFGHTSGVDFGGGDHPALAKKYLDPSRRLVELEEGGRNGLGLLFFVELDAMDFFVQSAGYARSRRNLEQRVAILVDSLVVLEAAATGRKHQPQAKLHLTPTQRLSPLLRPAHVLHLCHH